MATKNPYTTGQILSIYYNLVFKVGLYFLECKEWRSKVASDKTWTNFKVNFSQAIREIRKERANYVTQAYAENMEIIRAAIKDMSA